MKIEVVWKILAKIAEGVKMTPPWVYTLIKWPWYFQVEYHKLMPLVDFIIIIIAIYFNLFHAKLGLALCMKSFHTFLNIAHSGCNPSILMSKHFHTLPKYSCPCPHISPPPPPHFYRPTPNHPHFQALSGHRTFTLRMSKPPQSATSATLWTPGRLYKSTLRSVSFSDTPHIHLTIILRSNSSPDLADYMQFSAFIAHVLVSWVNMHALDTCSVYLAH